jgi:hypothetical protein
LVDWGEERNPCKYSTWVVVGEVGDGGTKAEVMAHANPAEHRVRERG